MKTAKRIPFESADFAPKDAASADAMPVGVAPARLVPAGFAWPLVLVLAAALVGGVGQGWIAGGAFGVPDTTDAFAALDWSRLPAIVLDACETALVEEILFRGVLLWACWRVARRMRLGCPVLWAIVASSLIFGLFHLLPAGELAAPHADIALVVAQGILKVVQATAFGALMALLVVRSLWRMATPHATLHAAPRATPQAVSLTTQDAAPGGPSVEEPTPAPLTAWASALIAPIVVHAAFDFLYLGPLLLVTGQLPATYLSGQPADLGPLAASTVLLVVAFSLALSKTEQAGAGE